MRQKHYALTKNSYFTLHKRDLSNYLDLLPFITLILCQDFANDSFQYKGVSIVTLEVQNHLLQKKKILTS